MSWEPDVTAEVRAEAVSVGDIMLSNMGHWHKVTERDADPNGSIVWTGKEMDTGNIANMWGNVGDMRTIGWKN